MSETGKTPDAIAIRDRVREHKDAARWRYVRECIRQWGSIPMGIQKPAGQAQKCAPDEIDAACDLSMKLWPLDGASNADDLLSAAADALDDAVDCMRNHAYSPSFMREAAAISRALRARVRTSSVGNGTRDGGGVDGNG